MSEINNIIFVRKKKATPEMLQLAEENEMILVECDYSMFKASGLLYKAGMKPVY
jgi:hypothetical protein